MNDWVLKYFDCGVGFDLQRIEGEGNPYPEPLLGLLKRFIALCRAGEGPCALPFIDDKTQVELLIASPTPEESTELRNIAHAYLGSAYALVGNAIVSNTDEAAYAVMLAHRSGGIVRVRVPKLEGCDDQYQNRVFRAMSLVLELLEQYRNRPLILSSIRRPTGRILRDLFIALRDENAEQTWQYYKELRDAQSLNARNMLFLEIQINAGLGNWLAIIEDPRLGHVASGRIPRRVSTALLAALEILMLRLDTLRTMSHEEVRERLNPIAAFFLREPDLDEGEANVVMWRTWATGAALIGNYNGADDVKKFVGEEWFRSLRELLDIPPEEEKSSTPEDIPLDVLMRSPESQETAIELLKSTLEGNDKLCRKIADRLRDYPLTIIDDLRKNTAIRNLWDGLLGEHESAKPIGGWTEWFSLVKIDPTSELLLQSAIDRSAYWKKVDWNEDALSQLIDDGSVMGAGIVRNVLPILLSWLEKYEITLSTNTAESLLLDLALDDVSSIQDLSLAHDLLQIAVSKPHNSVIYATMIDAVIAIWQKVKSVHGLPGIYDIFDLLMDAPCADEDSRIQLWQHLHEFLLSSWQRLNTEKKLLAIQYSREFTGGSEQFPEVVKGDEDLENGERNAFLSGKKLTIYTLTEGVARRAKEVLHSMYADLEIVLNHDKVETTALVNLSNTSDYFIFTSRSAAHQAFYAVQKRRRDMIYPSGKGASSIVRAFLNVINGG